jgi:hypothetical protein
MKLSGDGQKHGIAVCPHAHAVGELKRDGQPAIPLSTSHIDRSRSSLR